MPLSNLKLSGFSTSVLGLIFLRNADDKFTQVEAALAKRGKSSQGRRRTRDPLLPKLISGKVNVSNLDIQVEGVLCWQPSLK